MRTTTAFSPIRRHLLQQRPVGVLRPVSGPACRRRPPRWTWPRSPTTTTPCPANRIVVRSLENYAVPDVNMMDADGVALSLRSALADKPVILNFIFTSCGAVCPVMSRIFSQVRLPFEHGTRQGAHGVHFDRPRAGISTQAVLKAYADKCGQGDGNAHRRPA